MAWNVGHGKKKHQQMMRERFLDVFLGVTPPPFDQRCNLKSWSKMDLDPWEDHGPMELIDGLSRQCLMTRGWHCCQQFHDQRADFTFDITNKRWIMQLKPRFCIVYALLHSVVRISCESFGYLQLNDCEWLSQYGWSEMGRKMRHKMANFVRKPTGWCPIIIAISHDDVIILDGSLS